MFLFVIASLSNQNCIRCEYVDEGNVSPVKEQKECGSSVEFSNMALIETCFKKRKCGIFGVFKITMLSLSALTWITVLLRNVSVPNTFSVFQF